MQNVIEKISGILGVANVDIYLLAILLIFFGLFCFLGITKIYEIMFGLVLGISIYIVLQFLLLNPNLKEAPTFIDPKTAKFIVGSTIYLIFVLSILIPINGSFHKLEPKNKGLNILMRLGLAVVLVIFYLAIIAGFIEKIYIFDIKLSPNEHAKNAFELIKGYGFRTDFQKETKTYSLLIKRTPTITLIGIFLVIYKLIFSELVNMILGSILKTLQKIIKNAGKGGGKGGGGGGGGGGHGDSHGGGHGH